MGTLAVVAVTTAGTVITALLTLLGVRYTQRQVGRAAATSAGLEKAKVDAAAYDRAQAITESAMATLREQIEDLRRGWAADRLEHRGEMASLRSRIEDLERTRRQDRLTIQTLSTYIRDLLALLRHAQIKHPPPPPGLSDTDPHGWAPAT